MRDLEEAIRGRHASGDLHGAATVAIEGYSPEVLGYLIATLDDRDDAAEVFSVLSEDLWRGMAAFGWRCSFRTWMYTLARHALARHLRAPARRRERRVGLSEISAVAAPTRSSTMKHLRSAVKDAVAELRRALDADDQTLLILRVDRNMSWNDIARVFLGERDIAEGEIARESAKLRKRFETVKNRLRQQAQATGLIGGDN
jgi:RNA polymerase sigma-70 factor (ECF subfamily)